MEENKNKILSDLYCLRAGLSLLSVESAKLKSEDERLKNVTVKIEDNTSEIINYNAIIDTSKKTLKSSKRDYQSAKRKYDKKSYPLWLHSIITVCLLAIAGYLLYIREPASVYVLFFDVLLGVDLLFALVELVRVLLIKRKLKPYKEKMLYAKQLMEDSKVWIDESQKGAKSVESENSELDKKKKEYSLSYADSASLSLGIAGALNAAITRRYEKIIGKSYYEYLDLVIELIRSDSCKTVPEALGSIDAKKTAGTLEIELYVAYENMRSQMEKDLASLADELEKSYEDLYALIKEENDIALNDLKTKKSFLSGGIEEAKASFVSASSIEAMKLALSEKSVLGSTSIVESLEYILNK